MEVEKRVLKPVAGISGEIAAYLAGLDEVRRRLRALVADLTDDELAARAFPSAHQIGNLILHIGEAEAGWIWRIVAGKELDDEAKKFVHWNDTMESGFAEKGYSAAQCLGRLNEISRRSREILAKFPDEDLDKFFHGTRSDGREFEASLRWIFVHLIDHESVHRGQISMLKRILRENAV